MADVWCHGSYERFLVCDPKPRIIHKASVADRLVHHAIFRCIEPLFEPSFIFDSWSCRKRKGNIPSVFRAQKELERLSLGNRKTVWILKCDIKKFFQSINQSILLHKMMSMVDSKTLDLIRTILESFPHGLPLGNLTSQLCANIYMNSFDHFMKEVIRAPVYLRYSDDFIVASYSREYLMEVRFAAEEFLMQHLHLIMHPQKISLRPFHYGVDWLGYVLYPGYRTMRTVTRTRMWKTIQNAIEKDTDKRLDARLMSWYGNVSHCTSSYDKGKIDLLSRVM